MTEHQLIILSATVDDHQMNMSHIIRGDDHKINTFKQIQIYLAMKWELPSVCTFTLNTYA